MLCSPAILISVTRPHSQYLGTSHVPSEGSAVTSRNDRCIASPSSHHLLSCPALSLTAPEASAPPQTGSFWNWRLVAQHQTARVRQERPFRRKHTCTASVNTWTWERATCLDQRSSDNHLLGLVSSTEVIVQLLKGEIHSYVTLCSWLDPLMYRNSVLLSEQRCRVNHDATLSRA